MKPAYFALDLTSGMVFVCQTRKAAQDYADALDSAVVLEGAHADVMRLVSTYTATLRLTESEGS
jgi:hypothetical protein